MLEEEYNIEEEDDVGEQVVDVPDEEVKEVEPNVGNVVLNDEVDDDMNTNVIDDDPNMANPFNINSK